VLGVPVVCAVAEVGPFGPLARGGTEYTRNENGILVRLVQWEFECRSVFVGIMAGAQWSRRRMWRTKREERDETDTGGVPMRDIEAEHVHIGGLRAYLARPLGGTDAGMLLLPMVTGIGEQVREYAADLASSGVTALVWDPWHGRSSDDTEPQRLAESMTDLRDEDCLAEMGILLDHARGELGLARVGVIGWCLGGRFALLLGARDPHIATVVAYHPSILVPAPDHHVLDAVDHAARITAPTMIVHAGADTVMTTETFAALQSALQSRSVGATVVHVYPGAAHGFSNRPRQVDPVNAAAWTLSWPSVQRFVADTTATDG